jgi:hypothetical protein
VDFREPDYANFWDIGYPSGGNYWSDYTSVDSYSGPYQNETGSDGIGDTPYIIDEDNQDNYPFMSEYGWIRPPDLTVFDPEIVGLSVSVNGVVFPCTPDTTITRINWNWGDSNSDSQWFPATHSYADGGDYTIIVTAYQSDGLYSIKIMQVSLARVYAIDIKPMSWPNPINVKNKGVIPVAILGTDDFDVTQIDPATIRLEGAAPLRWSLEDADLEGRIDLVLLFKNQEVVDAFPAVNDGDTLPLTLTGNLKDEFGGTAIQGTDVIVIVKKGQP